jgi:hypothetical protein
VRIRHSNILKYTVDLIPTGAYTVSVGDKDVPLLQLQQQAASAAAGSTSNSGGTGNMSEGEMEGKADEPAVPSSTKLFGKQKRPTLAANLRRTFFFAIYTSNVSRIFGCWYCWWLRVFSLPHNINTLITFPKKGGFQILSIFRLWSKLFGQDASYLFWESTIPWRRVCSECFGMFFLFLEALLPPIEQNLLNVADHNKHIFSNHF